MTQKIIYILPEPGARTPKRAYDSGSIDLFFDFRNQFDKPLESPVSFYSNNCFQAGLGVRSFSTEDVGDFLVLPRSNCSVIKNDDTSYSESPVSSKDGQTVKNCHKMVGFHSLQLLNTAGLIDRDYRGELIARCQLVPHGASGQVFLDPTKPWLQAWHPDPEVSFVIVSTIEEVPENIRTTSRGTGGFGSSNQA